MVDDAFLPESEFGRASRHIPDQEFDRKLLRLMEEHGQAEGAILESYRQIAERTSTGEGIQFLVKLILEDEERHHEVLTEMANAIRSFLWEVPVEPRLPAMAVGHDADLLTETKRLIAFEKNDEKELRQLQKVLRDRPKTSLDPLMVDLMLHDTAKHIAILKFIKSRLANGRP